MNNNKALNKILNSFLIILGLFIAFALLTTCKEEFPATDETIFTIGTCNIEWLGDGIKDLKPRTDDELYKIANMLSMLEADIIGVQEIENDDAMKSIVSKMDGYKYYVCKSKNKSLKQKIGIIYKNIIKVKNIKEYISLSLPENHKSLRPGLICNVEKNGVDFLCMFVHLKSTSEYDSTSEMKNASREIRTTQNELLSKFVDSICKVNPNQKIILLGDFNDTPKRKKYNTMLSLLNNPNIHFLTSEQKSCKYRTNYTIDHIIVNTPAKEKYIDGSLFQLNIYNMFSNDVAKQISDHCPVLVKFDVSKTK
jgi:endonuclease/exonuclease/phosphatase family metal-dependent hydrolase